MTSVFDETICVTCSRSFVLKIMDRLQDKDNFCNIISNQMRLADDIHPVRTLFTCFSHISGTVLSSASDQTDASPQIANMSSPSSLSPLNANVPRVLTVVSG